MNTARRLRGWCTVTTVLAVVTVASPRAWAGTSDTVPPADEAAPTIEVANTVFPDDAVAAGSTFKLTGSGWTANMLVQLEVCGAEARSGSSDCSVATAQIVASDSAGTFRARLAVVVPPSPCPCVIRAFAQGNDQQAIAAVEIPGAPDSHPGDGDVKAPSLRRLEVKKVALRGSDSFATWFGQPAKRSLVFDVTNSGDVEITGATITLTKGDADAPTGFVPPIKLDKIAVGETRTLTVPIEFDSLAFGDQAVRGTVNGTSAPVVFRATTSTHPWLLIVIPIVIIGQLLLLFVRNRVRRRLHESDDDEVEVPMGPADDSLICVVEVAELDDSAHGLRHRTMVVRSIAAVQQLVLDSLHAAEAASVVGVAATVAADESGAAPDAVEEVDGPDDVEIDSADDVQVDGHEDVEADLDAAESEAADEPPHTVAHEPARIPDPASDAVPALSIATITVLADADARVGEAYHACDTLCDWIEATFAEAEHPAARALTLRRHVNGNGNTSSASASGLGMVPLSVMVRAAPIRVPV